MIGLTHGVQVYLCTIPTDSHLYEVEGAMRPIAIGRKKLAVRRQPARRRASRCPGFTGRQLKKQLGRALSVLEKRVHSSGG